MGKIDNSKLDPGTWGSTQAAKNLVEICKELNLRPKLITKYYHHLTSAGAALLFLAAKSNGMYGRFAEDHYKSIYKQLKTNIQNDSQLPPVAKSHLLNVCKASYLFYLRAILHLKKIFRENPTQTLDFAKDSCKNARNA